MGVEKRKLETENFELKIQNEDLDRVNKLLLERTEELDISRKKCIEMEH